MRKTIIRLNYLKLILISVIVSLMAALLADSLKLITAYYEEIILALAGHNPLIFIILPSIGITLIYFLRKYLFKGKQNKGIKEIYQTIEMRKNSLPAFKITSHYINGFLTVIFGGSTGIEVSTVVATAAIGSVAQRKSSIANVYKTELICAGVASGISVLFGSPIAGFLFAIEVIARKKVSKTILLSSIISSLMSWLFLFVRKGEMLFNFSVVDWRAHAIPYFILLSILCGLLAVYFTKAVIYIKSFFLKIENNFIKVNTGAILVGLFILCLPQLYGDSYHAIPGLMTRIEQEPFSLGLTFLLFAIVMIKPLAASLTLGSGGDGGVFAPSIVAGAVLGMMMAMLSNHYLNSDLIVLNFALVGAAAVLSAAINAPLTSIFLICAITTGGYLLFIPIFVGSFIAKYVAQMLCSYTVYSYNDKI